MLYLFLFSLLVFPQEDSFKYTGSIGFSAVDSLVSPYLCTVDSQGTVWIVSTNTVKSSAEHSVYKAAAGSQVFTLVKKFGTADSVRNITGIAAVGNDIFISARLLAPAGTGMPDYYPYSEMFYFPGGNAASMVTLKGPEHSYGTWFTAITADKAGYIYLGQSYLVTVGTLDGRKNSSAFGSAIDYARVDWNTAMEPGGGLTNPNVADLIRDIAVDPSADYSDTASVVYTSRNSSADPGGETVGGIAAWTGGSNTSPLSYHAARVTDLSGFLTFKYNAPYGIAVHPSTKYLYVCGTDDSKKWVKGFFITGNFAIQAAELPSSTSADMQDASGAPFVAPADIAFNSDGTEAYVVDESALKVFKFSTKATAVNENNLSVKSFEVSQNYPNPFNPSTSIRIYVPAASRLKAEVFNILGEKVAQLVNKDVSAGYQTINFNASGLSSGVYLCKVTSGNFSKTIKMTINK
jgi:hypothetical protein